MTNEPNLPSAAVGTIEGVGNWHSRSYRAPARNQSANCRRTRPTASGKLCVSRMSELRMTLTSEALCIAVCTTLPASGILQEVTNSHWGARSVVRYSNSHTPTVM